MTTHPGGFWNPPPQRRPGLRITSSMLGSGPAREGDNPYAMPTYLPGVLPHSRAKAAPGNAKLAMDDGFLGPVSQTYAALRAFHGTWQEGIGFMGYPYLADLVQRAEYRIPSEVLAEEMTRKWVRLTAKGEGDRTEKLKELDTDLRDFGIRDKMRDAVMLDGFFGQSMLQIDLGTNDDSDEILKPLPISKAKIGRGKFRGLKVIDPTWVAPNIYNSNDPLADEFYVPQTWFIMGREIASSRLMRIVSRPLPDLLKPAYNFGGSSLSQLMKPYVDNWLRTRQSVSDLLQAFTIFVLRTNMQATLQDNGTDGLINRMMMFNNYRDNRGLMMMDKETEEFENVSAPLGTLDALQAQSQEHMSAITRIPLVKAFGITPKGLNATTDGEIRVFYDTVRAAQERVLTGPMTTTLRILQLNRYGEIDPEIGFEFVPLWELDEAGKAAVRKTDADTDAVLLGSHIISPEEARKVLAASSSSPYAGLQGPPPDPPEDLTETGAVPGENADPAEKITNAGAGGSSSGANSGEGGE